MADDTNKFDGEDQNELNNDENTINDELDEEELEEERRLAYVAITRAKERLFLSSASQRMLFGTTQRNFTSRFIKEIDKNLIEKKDNTIVGKSDKPPVQRLSQ